MFLGLRLLTLVILVPIIIYFYFYIKRIFQFLNKDTSQTSVQIMMVIMSLVFVLPASNFFKFWAVVVLHLFAFSLLIDIIHHFIKKGNRLYQSGIIPILCVCMILPYGYYRMRDVQKTHYTIYTQKQLSRDYRIAYLSDLHFPNTMNLQELKTYCQDISLNNIDFVILGGDIVDEKTSFEQMKLTFQTLSSIHNKLGIYYVFGNHDEASYLKNPSFTPLELRKTIKECGIHILEDEIVTLQDELTLIGRKNKQKERLSSKQLFDQVKQDRFLMLLDHQPVELKGNDQLKYDLQLSGHTHGGQMFPVGLMIDYLGFGEMNYGYRKLNHLQVIVSSGIAGWGYPIRTVSCSEYVIIDMKSER